MANLIEQRVAAAQRGENPHAITRMASGWCVIGDKQFLPGYCVLLSDPVVFSLNDLSEAARAQYSIDMARIGDALIAIQGAHRINYLTFCNQEPSLHTHIIPRFMSEPEEKRRENAMQVYDREAARRFDPAVDGPFMDKMRAFLSAK
jgi:diadenosine tetraphosphate (Ap4A) HIT family hydrolase